MKQTQNKKFLKRLAVALLVLVICAIGVCSLTAMLIESEKLPEDVGAVISVVLLEILVFVVCVVTVKPLPQNRLLGAVITAVAFLMLRISFKSIFMPDAQWGRAWGMILTGAAALLGGLTASMKKERRR